MRKILFVLREMLLLVKKHRLAFLTPIFIVIILLIILAYYIGPAIITTFIYAGI